jgi:uncharacterized protein YuzE
MRYFYDEEHDSLMITFRDADYAESEEIFDGFVIDFDKSGRPMGIDIYNEASKFIDIVQLKRNFQAEAHSPAIEREPTFIRDAPIKKKR